MSGAHRTGGLQVTARVLALTPLLSPLVLYSFAVRARLALGRWPSFSNPDPKELGFDLHHAAWHLSLSPALAAAPLLIGMALVGWWRYRELRQEMLATVAVYVALLLLSIALLWADPGGFSEWMMD